MQPTGCRGADEVSAVAPESVWLDAITPPTLITATKVSNERAGEKRKVI